MVRLTLADIPPHLLPPSERKPKKALAPLLTPEAPQEVSWELMRLRGRLCRCAARVRCNPESILAEAGQIERVVAELRELAERA